MQITRNADKTYNFIMPDNRLYKVTITDCGAFFNIEKKLCGKVDPKKYKQGFKPNRISKIFINHYKIITHLQHYLALVSLINDYNE